MEDKNIDSCSHLLTGDELEASALRAIVDTAIQVKQRPDLVDDRLNKMQVALILDKPSLRTKFSFVAGIRQMGGEVIESLAGNRKAEEPADLIRVLQNYCDAVVIRTYADQFLQEMVPFAKIPIVNALSDGFHPCQALADIMTLQENFGQIDNLKMAYIGDNNNVLRSLMLMAEKLHFELRYCCPAHTLSDNEALATVIPEHSKFNIKCVTPQEAVVASNAVYTDVWTSMGFTEHDPTLFAGFQVNEELMSYAAPEAIFMHCMPMRRGVEVSKTLPDAPCSVIFQQCNNRLHVQKMVLLYALNLL